MIRGDGTAPIENASVVVEEGRIVDFCAFTAHRELRNMVASGLTPMQAITAATSTTAAFLGLRDVGVIRRGAAADFLLLDANPLDDVANTTRIAEVYLRGKRLDRQAMRTAFR